MTGKIHTSAEITNANCSIMKLLRWWLILGEKKQ